MKRFPPESDGLSDASVVRSTSGMRGLLVTWAPTLIYIGAILIMAARPAPGLPRIRHVDKYVHAAAYGLLALLSFRAFFQGNWKYPFFAALVLGAGVGAADEIVQYLGRVRTADVFDWCADVAGTAAGGLAARSLLGRRRMKMRQNEADSE